MIENSNNYTIKGDKSFLKWMNEMMKKGYIPFARIDDYQNLMDTVINWYREIEENNLFHGDELLSRLSSKMQTILFPRYRGRGGEVSNDGHIVTSFSIYQKIDCDSLFHDRGIPLVIKADAISGKILATNNIKEYFNDQEMGYNALLQKEDLDINSLHYLLSFYQEELDLFELEKITYCYDSDMMIRNYLLNMIELRLFNIDKSKSMENYHRIKRFMEELKSFLHVSGNGLNFIKEDKSEREKCFKKSN